MVLPLILGGLAVVSTIAQIDQGRRASKAARAQAEAEKRRAEIENIRKTRETIRQARLAQASMVNTAAQTGGMGSSGLEGGVGSIGSQMASNISYMSQIAEQNTAISNFAVTQASAQSNAQVWGAVGKLSGTIFSDMGGWSTIFGPKTPADPLGGFFSGNRGSGD